MDAYNIVIDHVSVGWALDENMATWGGNVRDLTITNSILSEALENSSVSSNRGKGILVGYDTTNFLMIGNLFAHNYD